MRLPGDIETRSECDLLLCGPYVYAEHPSTEVLCFSWAIDDGPITTWYPPTSTRPGQPMPLELDVALPRSDRGVRRA